MNKSTILVLISALLLTGVLYSLPKVVVNSKNQDVSNKKEETAPASQPEKDAAGHAPQTLSAGQLQQISDLKRNLLSATGEAKVGALIKISDTFRQFQKHDSAAYYAEKLAELQPTVDRFLLAGDRYYEAYGFAVGDEKAGFLGEKTRELYQKALDINPGLLAAKANLAMTYVNTPTPMQGILYLREILDADPTNELALFNLGILSIRSNQFSKAVERFQQILINNPENTKAQFYLALCFTELGKKEDALKLFDKVKKKEKDQVILQAVQELEQRLDAPDEH